MPDLCLILEPLRVVARDLAETLRDLTGCAPVLATTPDEALTQLAALDAAARLRTAFVHMDPASFAASPLHPLLQARGARIVLTAAQAGGQSDTLPWAILPRPFATADVRRALGDPG
jgi:hypothetical protein